jgi:uncharacterized repeat protein (TIGR02543 family)
VYAVATAVKVDGNVGTVAVAKAAASTTVTVGSTGVIATVETAADGVSISGEGTVTTAIVTGNDTEVSTDNTAVKKAADATGVVVSGEGSTTTILPTEDESDSNTTTNGSGSNTNKNTNATTSTVGGSGSGTNTTATTTTYKVSFESNGGSTVEEQTVTSGQYATEPEAPTQTGTDYTFYGWYSDEALTKPYTFSGTPVTGDITLYAKWYVSEETVDEYISGGIDDVNLAIANNKTIGPYATLGDLGTGADNNKVTVSMTNWDATVATVYTDIIQTLLNALNDHAEYLTSISTGSASLAIGETVDADAIVAFVKASGLVDQGNDAVTAKTVIGELNDRTLKATVKTVTGDEYTYEVTFKKAVPESTIDEIISGGIEDVNRVITETANHTPNSYATLSDLGSDNSVTVSITNGEVTVVSVYNDIVQTLLSALKTKAAFVDSIQTSNTAVLKVSGSVSATQIENFVKASGLKDNGGDVTGSTKLSALYGQTLTATVTTTCAEEYTYTVNFVQKSE